MTLVLCPPPVRNIVTLVLCPPGTESDPAGRGLRVCVAAHALAAHLLGREREAGRAASSFGHKIESFARIPTLENYV